MVYISRSELNAMHNNIIDEETGLTEYDLFENAHCYEDWEIFEDVKD